MTTSNWNSKFSPLQDLCLHKYELQVYFETETIRVPKSMFQPRTI